MKSGREARNVKIVNIHMEGGAQFLGSYLNYLKHLANPCSTSCAINYISGADCLAFSNL